jgi:hypothetical protein
MKKSSGKILSSLLLLSLSPKLIAQSNLSDEIDFISYQSKADKLAIEVKDLQGKIAILIKKTTRFRNESSPNKIKSY